MSLRFNHTGTCSPRQPSLIPMYFPCPAEEDAKSTRQRKITKASQLGGVSKRNAADQWDASVEKAQWQHLHYW
eukprot:5102727-Amphidinium_carterae.1